jgi:adenine-specific DNA-methyltransferase
MPLKHKHQKLELTWIGKGEEPKLEPRILIENPQYSYGDPATENMLIHGDNLLALKALEQDFTGKIKCIYIDPPFNTGAAFEHYDDGVEHSIWLNLMYQRFKMLRNLLSPDGVIMVHLDNAELAYCKVVLDEVFERRNFLNMITMTTNDPSGFKATSSKLFSTSNFLLLYSKERLFNPIKKIYREKHYDTAYSKIVLNRNDELNKWKFSTVIDEFVKSKGFDSVKSAKIELNDEFDELVANFAISNAYSVFQLAAIGGGAAIKRSDTIEKSKKNKGIVYIHPDEDVEDFYILNGRQILFYDKRVVEINGKMTPGEILTDVWTDISWNGIANEGGVSFKNGKKPEALIKRCLELTTEENDWMLDSFLGSGTSVSVAHKMKRKYIGIELGQQAYTHCYLRLKQTVNGKQDGVSEIVNWKGGGGFKFYTLAPSLLNKDKYGNWVITKEYNAQMLAAAMAKQEGFRYAPNEQVYWKQGRSSEQDFIFTTTQFVTIETLDNIHEEMQGDESLLICCKSFQEAGKGKYPNITIKKIPQMLLGRCEFGKEDYSLNIVNLPTENESEVPTEKPSVQEIRDTKTRAPKPNKNQNTLF